MSGSYHYKNAIGATTSFDEDLGDAVIRLGDIAGLAHRAEHLQSGTAAVTFDNPDANLGHDSDNILGNQIFYVNENAAPAGNRRLATYVLGARNYARGDSTRPSLRTGASNQINAELHDLNTLPSLRVIPQSDRTAIRSRETVTARMTWIMGTTYMANVADAGLIVGSAKFASKADYRGQRAVNVINDCEIAAGFGWNAFVYWDEAGSQPALFFDNANTSTAYSSTLSLSNVLTDKTSTCLMAYDAQLRRDPSDLADRIYMPFRNGYVYRHRQATTDIYGNKDIIAPSANVARRDRARTIADDILFQHHTEEDRITCKVDVPAAQATLIRAGHRILVKFSHLPGYTSFTYCRIILCAPGQQQQTDAFYTFSLELSPMEPTCGGLVQRAGVSQFNKTLGLTPTPGNVLVAVGVRKNINPVNPIEYLGVDAGWTDLGQPLASTGMDNGQGRAWMQAVAVTSSTPAGPYGFSDGGQEVWDLYEIAADFSNRTVLSQAQGTAPLVGAATLSMGTFSNARGTVLMAQMVGKQLGYGACINHNGTADLITMGGTWNERYDGRIDPLDSGSLPFLGIGDNTGDGDDIAASWAWQCLDGDLGTWAGIACLFGC